MIDKDLETNLQNAFIEATALRCQWITPEGLLLQLLDNCGVKRLLADCGCDCAALRRGLREFIDKQIPKLSGAGEEPRPSIGFQRVIERAIMHVRQSGRGDQDLHGEDVLVSIFDEPDSWAVCLLADQGIRKLTVTGYLCEHGFGAGENASGYEGGGEQPEGPEGEAKASSDPLEDFTENLNEKAQKGLLDPLVGRDREINRIIQVLCRRRKNNPLLVGEPGVGKTAIAEGLAARIASGDVPEVLRGRVVRSLTMGRLVAGTKYRGDFEQRMKSLVDAVRKAPETILFIDEIHTVVGAGATGDGRSMDAADLFKPALGSGDVTCVGATTYEEFRRIFEKDRALARRFQKVDVPPATRDEAVEILKGLRCRLEKHHEVAFSDEAIEAAVALSERYITDRHLPDKAIDVLDEAGAAQRLLPAGKRVKEIGAREVEKTVAEIARVPAEHVAEGDAQKLRALPRELKSVIFGQDKAIDKVVSAIRLSRSGLSGRDRPVGSFLFTGPTGVGKTELARQLARALGIELLRFDMSEYSEGHSVSRLIGAPPGYVGFDQGGQLTEAVTRHPYAVVLLDEIEKAHPEIYNVLLQVMDRGVLTDNAGRQADFRNVVLIMTSNAGARQLSRNVIGFGESSGEGDDTAEINRTFTPEFRNRLDAIVRFAPLGDAQVVRIVGKLLGELSERLAEKNVTAIFTPALRSFLAQKGADPQMGARPMRRLVEDRVYRPLSEELLFGKLQNGGSVTVGFRGGEVILTVAQAGSAAHEKLEKASA